MGKKTARQPITRANIAEMEPFDLNGGTPDHMEVCNVAINGKELTRAEYDAHRGIFYEPGKRTKRVRNVTHWQPQGGPKEPAHDNA